MKYVLLLLFVIVSMFSSVLHAQSLGVKQPWNDSLTSFPSEMEAGHPTSGHDQGTFGLIQDTDWLTIRGQDEGGGDVSEVLGAHRDQRVDAGRRGERPHSVLEGHGQARANFWRVSILSGA